MALFKDLKDALHKNKKKIVKTIQLRYEYKTNYMNLDITWTQHYMTKDTLKAILKR